MSRASQSNTASSSAPKLPGLIRPAEFSRALPVRCVGRDWALVGAVFSAVTVIGGLAWYTAKYAHYMYRDNDAARGCGVAFGMMVLFAAAFLVLAVTIPEPNEIESRTQFDAWVLSAFVIGILFTLFLIWGAVAYSRANGQWYIVPGGLAALAITALIGLSVEFSKRCSVQHPQGGCAC